MVISGSGRDVATVIVDGRVVMKDRELRVWTWTRSMPAPKQYDGLIATFPERSFQHPPGGRDLPAIVPDRAGPGIGDRRRVFAKRAKRRETPSGRFRRGSPVS